MNRNLRPLAAVGAVIAVAMLAGCGGSSGPADFTLIRNEPDLTEIDNGAPVGDANVFDADLTKDGAAFGRLFGEQTVIAEPDPTSPKRTEEVRRTELNFELPDGQIVVQGTGPYTKGSWRLTVGKPVVQAIVGGTKAYAGVQGELTSTRNEDGSYTQAFHFVD
jgi:hypothetical protein